MPSRASARAICRSSINAQSLTAQLRWQAADAIAKAQPEGALRMLRTLLDDPTPGVAGSAALALARSGDAERCR